jgi:lipopolysaccharide export LptBFGC system permease protein LptF
VGAAFSWMLPRSPRYFKMLFLCIISGFSIYFLSDVTFALTASANIPLLVGALLPSFIAAIFGFILNIHFEHD